MTNGQIISNELTKLNMDPLMTIVDTYPGWKRAGYQVKKGEKALFKTKIWKPLSKRNKKTNEEEVSEDTMFLVNAAFFLDSQVEKIKG